MAGSCKKDIANHSKTSETLPFENENIKLELISKSVPSNVRGIHFFDSTTGVSISYEGKIYKSTDSGATWTLKYSNPTPDQPLYQVLFIDSNVGYVVGGSNSCGGTGCIPPGGLILKTIDGGNSWTKVFQMSKVEFLSIASNISGDLFVVSHGTKGRIFKSINAGINWTIVDSTDFVLNTITFRGNYGFCTGQYGNIIRSIDNGGIWKLAATVNANYIGDIKFNGGNGYCIANNQTVYKTIDNGNNWTQNFHSDFQTYTLNPLTENSCLAFGAGRFYGGDWVYGNYGAIRLTKNSGNDWTETEFSDIEEIRYTSFYSASEGYANSGTRLIKVTVK